MKLLDAVTVDVDGPSVPVKPFHARKYDIYTFYAKGTFGGGTVQLQISLDETTWYDVPNAVFTAKGVLNVQFRAPFVRAKLSGSSGATITSELR